MAVNVACSHAAFTSLSHPGLPSSGQVTVSLTTFSRSSSPLTKRKFHLCCLSRYLGRQHRMSRVIDLDRPGTQVAAGEAHPSCATAGQPAKVACLCSLQHGMATTW